MKPLVTSQKELLKRAQKMSADEWVAIDTETSGLDLYAGDELRGISFASPSYPKGFYVSVSHPDQVLDYCTVGGALAIIFDSPATLVWHHAVFDWCALRQAFGDVRCDRAPFVDTMVASWLLDENRRHGLKAMAAEYYGDEEKAEQAALRVWAREHKILMRDMWGVIDAETIAPYAAQDAALTGRLMGTLIGTPGYQELHPVPGYQRELRLQQVLARMTHRGIGVDLRRIEEGKAAFQARVAEIQGMFPDHNLASTMDTRHLLYDVVGLQSGVRTATGLPSTSREALEEHVGDPVVDLLLEYRHKVKAVSSYFKPLQKAGELTGRVHPWFSSTRTVTGRLACSGPNLMTIPRDDSLPEVRRCFVPAKGWELWEYDLKQAELRVAASLTGDPALTAMLVEEGRDLHTETAVRLFGDASGRRRTLAKNVNFGILYGAGPKKIAQFVRKLDPSISESVAELRAQGILREHRNLFPKLHSMNLGLQMKAKSLGYLPLHVEGRYRHFRSPKTQVEYYTALNALVQGGVAEFVKDTMLRVEEAPAYRLLLQVHDALIFEVLPGCGLPLMDKLNRTAADLAPFRVPMEWEAKQWAK